MGLAITGAGAIAGGLGGDALGPPDLGGSAAEGIYRGYSGGLTRQIQSGNLELAISAGPLMKELSRLHVGRSVAVLAVISILLASLYVTPFWVAGGPVEYISARQRWFVFIVLGWILGPLFLYISYPLFIALLGRPALYVDRSCVVFLSERFSVDLRCVKNIALVDRHTPFFRLKSIHFETLSGDRYLPLALLEETPEEVFCRVNLELRAVQASDHCGNGWKGCSH